MTPGRKAEARTNLRQFLEKQGAERSGGKGSIGEMAVRINSVDSGYALDDLREVVSSQCFISVFGFPHTRTENQSAISGTNQC